MNEEPSEEEDEYKPLGRCHVCNHHLTIGRVRVGPQKVPKRLAVRAPWLCPAHGLRHYTYVELLAIPIALFNPQETGR